MRPLSLKGHGRPVTQIKLNQQGDLLFSAAKDKVPCVWYTENGERVGTYNGHNGAVWCLDASHDSSRLLTGAADNFCFLWDTERGEKVGQLANNTVVRSVGFSYSSRLFFVGSAKMMKQPSELRIFDVRDPDSIADNRPELTLLMESTPNAAVWAHLDDHIITGHDNGNLNKWDIRLKSNEPVTFGSHSDKGDLKNFHQINDLQLSADQTMLISASKDKTARLWDAKSLQQYKTYRSERPVNSAAISPIRDHIVLGGGEEQMKVTQTAAAGGHFEAKFYHLVYEFEFAKLKGHFGPINSLAFHPDGRTLLTGGEDAYIRIQHFDDDYFEFEIDD